MGRSDPSGSSSVSHIANEMIHLFAAQVTLMGGAGEIGRSLSQMLKQTPKINMLVMNDVASLRKFVNPVKFPNFSNGEPLNPAVRFLSIAICSI